MTTASTAPQVTSTITALVCALLVTLACATDEEVGAVDAAAVKTACPKMANSCPDECDPVDGYPVHETTGDTGACVEDTSVVIGCIPRPFDRILTADMGCVKRAADGQRFDIPTSGAHARSLLEDPRWVTCTEGPAFPPTCESH